MAEITSVLTLQRLVFDKIEFDRKGFKNESQVEFGLQVQVGVNDDDVYKVTLVLTGDKEKEYSLLISLSGFFKIDDKEKLDDNMIQELINKNTVAIMMPYLRSEISLLTAQPDTDCVVLPPFNINKMIQNKS